MSLIFFQLVLFQQLRRASTFGRLKVLLREFAGDVCSLWRYGAPFPTFLKLIGTLVLCLLVVLPLIYPIFIVFITYFTCEGLFLRLYKLSSLSSKGLYLNERMPIVFELAKFSISLLVNSQEFCFGFANLKYISCKYIKRFLAGGLTNPGDFSHIKQPAVHSPLPFGRPAEQSCGKSGKYSQGEYYSHTRWPLQLTTFASCRGCWKNLKGKFNL